MRKREDATASVCICPDNGYGWSSLCPVHGCPSPASTTTASGRLPDSAVPSSPGEETP
jgi:hypothetical protein